MKIIKREPGVGYIDNRLWLPKSHTNRDQIQRVFTYEGKDGNPIEAWREERYHFLVPRNYLRHETLGKLPYPVYDVRQKIFPYVNFHSRVVLDAKEPDKDYQRKGSEALLSAYDGILCLRCGAGKTVVALHTASLVHVPTLIMVSDEGLAEQWYEEIREFIDIEPNDIGFIGGERGKKTRKDLDWKHPIVIAHVQTIARRAEEEALPAAMLHHFGVIIPDEAHIMGAPYFNGAMPPFHGRRWGLSATPEREDGFDTLLRYTVGSVVYTYLTPDLSPVVYFRELSTTIDFSDKPVRRETHDATGELHFGMLYGYMARELTTRTDAVEKDIRDALANDRQVLVLTHSKDMTEILGTRFPNAGVVNGDVKGEERRRRIRECNPVIAIMALGKQALNKPSLDTLYVVEPYAKKGILQQTMGRVLRKFAGKRQPIVVFFEDVNVSPIANLCGKIRTLMNKWPAHKGGRIKYKLLKIK